MPDDYNPTEWLANCVTGYGWGRTKEGAVYNMLANMDPVPDRYAADGELNVQVVEHRGSARVGPGGYTVEEFVSGQRLTLDAERASELRNDALNVSAGIDRLLDEPVDAEEIETVGDRE